MIGRNLQVTDGEAAGAWIRLGLQGKFGAVTLHVPQGYEAYARIFHPASDAKGGPVKWADVAEVAGTVVHPEMQWHAILGLAGPEYLRGSYQSNTVKGPRWTGTDPMTGGMDPNVLDSLCEILIVHTADPGHSYFGLCTIENWLNSFLADDLKPLLKLPMDREYVVLTGPLSAVDQIGRFHSRSIASLGHRGGELPKHGEYDWKRRKAPNLIWPADHSWLVASEVDFDSTLVGGSAELVKAIVESPELEAWQVEPTESLAADADKVNSL